MPGFKWSHSLYDDPWLGDMESFLRDFKAEAERHGLSTGKGGDKARRAGKNDHGC